MYLLREAATLTGMTTGRLAQLIRSKKLRAKQVRNAAVACGYHWEIPISEVERLRREPKAAGRPRSNENRRTRDPILPTKARPTTSTKRRKK